MSRLEDPRVRVWLWVVGSVAAVSLVIGMIVAVTTIYELTEATRQTQITNTQRQEADRVRDELTAATAADAARSAERIEDCTTPGRPCYEDAQRRTGEAVAGINQGTLAVITAALSCQADGITDQKALSRCTVRRAEASTVGGTTRQP